MGVIIKYLLEGKYNQNEIEKSNYSKGFDDKR